MRLQPFDSLDYLYLPAPEIETAISFYTDALGGELLRKIRDWSVEGEPFELPQGPCLVFRDPGRQRFAVYERVRAM